MQGEEPIREPLLRSDGRRHAILVIDDSTLIHRILRFKLGSLGAETRIAATGEDGLLQAQASPPDLILLDLNLPGLSGFAVLRMLKADPVLAKVPVIILSGEGDSEPRDEAFRCGAVDYITKPFTDYELRARVMTVLKNMELLNDLAHQARTDPLTGLPNRLAFLEHLEARLEAMRKGHALPFAIMFIDLDRFKIVNDSLGHEVGDRVLCDAAEAICKSIRESRSESRPEFGDLVCRIGGDEFTVILGSGIGEDRLSKVGERLIAALSQPRVVNGYAVHIGASVGVRSCHDATSDAATLLRDADAAMYKAKEAGRGQCIHFDDAIHQAALSRLEHEQEVRRAVKNQEFILRYQPIIDIDTGRLNSIEALIRWNDPNHGERLPSDLIPMAEEIGLIGRIGEWVLREACRQMVAWGAAFGRENLPIMSVNVSQFQFTELGFIERLDDALREYNIDPAKLQLEVTENVVVADSNAVRNTMQRVRERGCQMAIDDFGTGYSSLSALHTYPFNTLKIDRAFVGTMQQSREFAAVVQAIVTLAQNFGMSVIAEGVEEESQIAMLKSLDCSLIQGYYFSKPLLPDEIVKYFNTEVITPRRAA